MSVFPSLGEPSCSVPFNGRGLDLEGEATYHCRSFVLVSCYLHHALPPDRGLDLDSAPLLPGLSLLSSKHLLPQNFFHHPQVARLPIHDVFQIFHVLCKFLHLAFVELLRFVRPLFHVEACPNIYDHMLGVGQLSGNVKGCCQRYEQRLVYVRISMSVTAHNRDNRMLDQRRHTFYTLGNALPDANDALAKLLLRILQVLIGVTQMLHFIVELLLHLRQLLRRKTCQVDCVGVSALLLVLHNVRFSAMHLLCCPFSPVAIVYWRHAC